MRIAIDNVFWTQAIEAGGLFGKSLAAKPGVQLFYVGHGVLVEQDGKPARLIPMSNVLVMEARGGFLDFIESTRLAMGEATGLKSAAAMEALGELPPGSLKAQLEDMAHAQAEQRAASAALAEKRAAEAQQPKKKGGRR